MYDRYVAKTINELKSSQQFANSSDIETHAKIYENVEIFAKCGSSLSGYDDVLRYFRFADTQDLIVNNFTAKFDGVKYEKLMDAINRAVFAIKHSDGWSFQW